MVPSDFCYLYKGAVVNSAYNNKNFESLDKDTLYSIISGILLLQLLEKKITKIEQLNQVILFPMQMNSASIYYKDDGNLVSTLQWYPDLVKDIQQVNRKLHTIVAEHAVPQLEIQKQQMIAQSFSIFQLFERQTGNE